MEGNRRQLFHAYLEDGLMEATMGAAMLSLGAWFLLEEIVFLAWMMPWMFLSVILPGAKKKSIAPRGGMVDLPAPAGRQRFVRLILLGLSLLGLIGLVFATGAQRDAAWFQPIEAGIDWMADHFAAMLGLAFCLILAMLGIKGDTRHLTLLGPLALIAGIVIDALIASGRLGGLVLGLAVGIPLMILGLIRYARFCRIHPPLDDQLMA